jgi:hypothetical protein
LSEVFSNKTLGLGFSGITKIIVGDLNFSPKNFQKKAEKNQHSPPRTSHPTLIQLTYQNASN